MSVRERLLERARVPIREAAIKLVKRDLKRRNRRREDYTEDEVEELVAEKEKMIRRWLGVGGLLAAAVGIV